MKKLLSLVCALFLFGIAAGPAAAAERGIASWYGGKFHGRLTANGEIFDTNKLTAAHRTLPFDTRVKVTNLNTGKSVVVRINDRGPFLHGRIIDLSQAAAMKIGMLESGTAPVTVEILTGNDTPTEASTSGGRNGGPPYSPEVSSGPELPLPEPETPGIGKARKAEGEEAPAGADPGPAPAQTTVSAGPRIPPGEIPRPSLPGGQNAASAAKVPASTDSPASPNSAGSPAERFSIQLGSFSVQDNALGLKSRLERAGFLPRLEPAGNYTRVVLTGLTESEVSHSLRSLERAGFSDYLVRAD